MITQTSESLHEEDALLQGKGGLRAGGAVDSVEEKRSELLNLGKELTECLDYYMQERDEGLEFPPSPGC